MSQPVIQASFNSGEWAPALYARVDLTKYHSGAALLRNFFVDYRGGATARAGTRYILQTRSTDNVRLIPFQASLAVSYILEFGQGYVRFFNNGAPVLENSFAISGATQAAACVVTATGSNYSTGDWVFITGVVGMTQLNGNYYRLLGTNTNQMTLGDLNGNAINSTGFGAYISGGTVQRVYTISSPYLARELSQIKFAQDVNILFLCHPNHPPYQLTLTSATNWSLAAITFGSTVPTPTGISGSSNIGAGTVFYNYVVTAVDANGQESEVSSPATFANLADIRSTGGTINVGWSAVTGAVSYNVYRTQPRYGNTPSVGSSYGFMGNVTGTIFYDSNITPDFSQPPPVAQNPFSGAGVSSVTITASGIYTHSPGVSFTGGGSPTAVAQGYSVLQGISLTAIGSGGTGYRAGNTITLVGGVVVEVLTATPFGGLPGTGGVVLTVALISGGSITGAVPANPVPQTATSGSGVGFTCGVTWGVSLVVVTSPGAGYSSAPNVVFDTTFGSGASATSTLGAASAGNPSVPAFFQQRMFLAGPISNPQLFNFSQPGSIYNYDTTNPILPDNAITGTLVSGTLNTIQSATPFPQGLLILTDKQAWLINGGSPGSAVSATAIVANSQAYNGSAGLPPIVANDNILYVQAKGSIVRDLVFNYYTQVYTGTDISVLSSHLFYGYQLLEWAWCEEPFKLVWAVRNDGTLLTLTFLKEQELIAWGHSDTLGAFKSVATVTEAVSIGNVDALYTVVQRVVNGNTIQYIERMAELSYPNGATDAWCVDAGIQFNGAASLTFSGAQHLAGLSVTGLATDDKGNVTVIPAFAMPVSGTFTLAAPPAPATGYTRVTIGIPYLPQLQTLPIDLGEPTVQGKRKKITGVTVRCNQTLGLSIGSDANNLVAMADLTLGNVGSATNAVVTNLVTGDARTIIDPKWSVPGQYFIQQSNPYPASILGVIPEITIGDTK